jgi:hypothetical protein
MSAPTPMRWCGVEQSHIAHNFAQTETIIGITAHCPGSAGSNTMTTTPLEPDYPNRGTVSVRLDGLADKIAAVLLGKGSLHGFTIDDFSDNADAVVRLLQSLAVQR